MHRWIKYIGYLTVLVGLSSAAYNAWRIYDQHLRITTYQSVDGVVLSARAEQEKTKGFVLYKPIIEYEYTVGGQTYKSDITAPSKSLGPQEWAEGVAAKFPAGAEINVRIDPDNPADSFLLPKYGGLPYLGVLVSVVIGGMGVGVVHEAKSLGVDRLEVESNVAGAKLTDKRDHRGSARLIGGGGMLGLLIGAPAWAHYLAVSTPPHDFILLIFIGAYNLVGAGMIGWALISILTRGGFGPAELRTGADPPTIGQPFTVSLSQPIYFSGTIRSMTLQIVCQQKNRAIFDISPNAGEDPVIYAETVELFEGHPVERNSRLETQAEFLLPAPLPSSTPTDDKSLKHIVWSLRLNAADSRFRKHDNEYVVEVTGE